jgi:hypothetical protein
VVLLVLWWQLFYVPEMEEGDGEVLGGMTGTRRKEQDWRAWSETVRQGRPPHRRRGCREVGGGWPGNKLGR